MGGGSSVSSTPSARSGAIPRGTLIPPWQFCAYYSDIRVTIPTTKFDIVNSNQQWGSDPHPGIPKNVIVLSSSSILSSSIVHCQFIPEGSNFQWNRSTFLLAAIYGGRADVTDTVKSLVIGNSGLFNVNNTTMKGDPVPGARKALQILFINSSEIASSTSYSDLIYSYASEGGHLTYPGGDYVASGIPMHYVHDNWTKIRDKSVRSVTMLGSHDAGMSQTNTLTAGCQEKWVKTQNLCLKDQLYAGVRFFDLRIALWDHGGIGYDNDIFQPAINPDWKWVTKHFAEPPRGLVAGAYGEPILSFAESLDAFCAVARTVIFLQCSEPRQFVKNGQQYAVVNLTPSSQSIAGGNAVSNLPAYAGNHDGMYGGRPYEYWDAFYRDNFQNRVRNMWNSSQTSLSMDTTYLSLLGEVGGHPLQSKIVLVIDDVVDQQNPKRWIAKHELNVTGGYSNTDDFAKMYSDQKTKMATGDGTQFFVFHSELTQQTTDGIPHLNYNLQSGADSVRSQLQALRQPPDSDKFKARPPTVILMDYVNDASRGLVEHINDITIGANSKTFNSRLSIENRGDVLVLVDFTTDADCRYAFFPGKHVNYGDTSKATPNSPTIIMKEFPNGWSIREETGVLVFRNSNGSDCRYAFYPGNYQDIGANRGTYNSGGPTRVLYQSTNWVIQEENGALCIRDTKNPGDNRFAFFCGNYVDM